MRKPRHQKTFNDKFQITTVKLPTVTELWDFFNSTGLICQEPKNLYI